MLLHNSGGYMQASSYYPEPMYVPNYATPPPTHFDVDFFTQPATHYNHHPLAQTHPQAYYPTSGSNSGYTLHHQGYSSCAAAGGMCSCPPKPVQETFLHKILTGKGYKNDAISLDHGHGPAGGHHLHQHSPQHSPQHYQIDQFFNDYLGASCCYSGLSALSMADSYPASIPRIS